MILPLSRKRRETGNFIQMIKGLLNVSKNGIKKVGIEVPPIRAAISTDKDIKTYSFVVVNIKESPLH